MGFMGSVVVLITLLIAGLVHGIKDSSRRTDGIVRVALLGVGDVLEGLRVFRIFGLDNQTGVCGEGLEYLTDVVVEETEPEEAKGSDDEIGSSTLLRSPVGDGDPDEELDEEDDADDRPVDDGPFAEEIFG